MKTPFTVTLDGPAGVGKSTLAKRLAGFLGISYLDTGAMFRTLALALEKEGVALDSPDLERILGKYVFTLEGAGAETALYCNGRRIGDEIRTEEAGMAAAKAAKVPAVRAVLKTMQQDMGKRFSLAAEGRDMGTEVFPKAACKIFLDARPEVRAERRRLQLLEMGKACDLAELTEQIRARDHEDRTRSIAPLRPAEDAHVVDTSDMDVEAVFSALTALAANSGCRAE